MIQHFTVRAAPARKLPALLACVASLSLCAARPARAAEIDLNELVSRSGFADGDQVPEAGIAASDREDASYQQGVGEANAELERGVATFYTYGLRRDLSLFDRQTGLPLLAIAGCMVSEHTLRRAQRHNDTINRYIARRGLPPNSFKPWEWELYHLKKYYALRMKTETPARLVPGGPAVKSPAGKYGVRVVDRPLERADGTLTPTLSMIVTVDNKDQEGVYVASEATIDFLWGPPGSGFVVVRTKAKDGLYWFSAVDLKRGKDLHIPQPEELEGLIDASQY
jgi:hypothetical protein